MDLLERDQGVDPAQHWYYRAKAQALHLALDRARCRPATINDVGAGSGFFSAGLLERFPDASARCIDPHYDDAQLATSTARLSFHRELREPADLYLLMDVLEHVADDRDLLRRHVEQAPGGALFFLSVPALSFLWSGHDDFLGHHRRYTLPQLERVVRDCGLRQLSGRYLYGATLPVVGAVRLLRRRSRPASDLKPASALVNTALTRVLAAENRLPGNRLAGSTAVVLAERR